MRLHYLITGTGRCGTVYLARLLTSAGIPCGHESFFDYEGLEGALGRLRGEAEPTLSLTSRRLWDGDRHLIDENWMPNLRALVAESSYMAAPFIDHPVFDGTQMIHVVRNPMRVIDSFVNHLRYFQDPSGARDPGNILYENNIYDHFPELTKKVSVLERACLYYVRWNAMIEQKIHSRPHVFLRIEDDPAPVLEMLGRPELEVDLGTTINSFRRKGVPACRLEDVPPGLIKSEFLEMARRYGYDLASEYDFI
jgi:hypothetical protein